MRNFIYLPFSYYIMILRSVFPFTPLKFFVYRLYQDTVIVIEFVKIRFMTLCYRSFRLQGTIYIPRYFLGLAVILAYYIITFLLIPF